MRSLGFDVKKAEVLASWRSTMWWALGLLYDEFLDIMARRIAERSPEEELRKAFELFDEDGTGGYLKSAARREGTRYLSDDELQAMIEEFDTDGDKEISLEDFAAIMNRPACTIRGACRGPYVICCDCV